jgi:hypothetical protein
MRAVDTVTRDVAAEADRQVTQELPEERRKTFTRTGFLRMSLDWKPDEQIMMTKVHRAVRKRLVTEFADLLELQFDLLLRAGRLPEVDPDGQPTQDDDGYYVWKRTTTGAYVENWDRLTAQERERFLYRIYLSIAEWRARATKAWGESMFAKAIWEEAFAEGFRSAEGARTVDDREHAGRLSSMEQRYFALFQTYYSRMAESYVKSMEDLGQRLKDVHQAASGR